MTSRFKLHKKIYHKAVLTLGVDNWISICNPTLKYTLLVQTNLLKCWHKIVQYSLHILYTLHIFELFPWLTVIQLDGTYKIKLLVAI